MLIRPNVKSGKSKFWKIGFQENLISAKCELWLVQILEKSFRGNVTSGKCTFRQMYIWVNVIWARVFRGNAIF